MQPYLVYTWLFPFSNRTYIYEENLCRTDRNSISINGELFYIQIKQNVPARSRLFSSSFCLSSFEFICLAQF